eukprot:s7854_g3.t1
MWLPTARLQPLWKPGENGQLMLLSFRLALLLDELRLATLPLPLVLSAPQGVTVSCAWSKQGQGGGALIYPNISVSWRLLATQQRSALLSRCTPQDAFGDSSLLLELQAPPSSGSEAPGEWLALPILVASAEEETFASEQTWRLRVGDSLAEVRTNRNKASGKLLKTSPVSQSGSTPCLGRLLLRIARAMSFTTSGSMDGFLSMTFLVTMCVIYVDATIRLGRPDVRRAWQFVWSPMADSEINSELFEMWTSWAASWRFYRGV